MAHEDPAGEPAGEPGLRPDSAPPLPVTVVIPAYNRAAMLARALASVAAQRPRAPAELIVVDDCSTDDTGDVARRFGARVLRNRRNLGEGGSRNVGVRAAGQPWIALLDSDDEWLPHHLDTLWRLRSQHVLVSGSCLGVGPERDRDIFGGTIARRPQVLRSPAALVYPENFITASGALVRRDLVLEVGGYDEALRFGADLDLWVRILERGTGVVSPSVGTLYHLHDGQVTQDKAATRAAHEALARSYAGRPWWSPRLVEQVRGVSAWETLREAMEAGDGRTAVRNAALILRSPARMDAVVRLWVRRLHKRRRAAATARDGRPSLALLPGRPGPIVEGGGRADEREVVDLTGYSPIQLVIRLLRRPPGEALAGSAAQAAALRLLGIRPLRVDAGGVSLRARRRPPRAPEL